MINEKSPAIKTPQVKTGERKTDLKAIECIPQEKTHRFDCGTLKMCVPLT